MNDTHISEYRRDAHVGDFRRDVLASQMRHELMRQAFVVVGDHAPEPRLKPPTRGPDGTFHNPTDDPDICDADGLPVAQCGGAACRSHKRCCWQ